MPALRHLFALLPLLLAQAPTPDGPRRREARPAAAGPAVAPVAPVPHQPAPRAAAPHTAAPRAATARAADQPAAPLPADPRATVWTAVLAVEGDSAAAVRERWAARRSRDPRDRLAVLGLATLDRLQARYDDARRGYEALVRGSAPADDAVLPYARAGLAAVAQGRGFHQQALAEYGRAALAARAVGDLPAEVQARLGVARARARLQGPVAALALLDSIRPGLPAADLRLRATYGAARAAILAQLGRAEARAVALECVDLARRADAARVEVACYQPLAMDGERRGDTKPAIELLDEVARRNREANDRWALANTLQWQGYLLTTRGDYGRARATLREALAHGEASRNGAALAWASLRLARIAHYIQDRAAARALVARSVDAFQRQGDVAGAMEARELEVTLTADAGDHARARGLAAEQVQWARSAALPRREFTALMAQAVLAERQRDWPAALATLDSARAVLRRHAMTGWRDVLHYHEGLVALRRGQLGLAERAFTAHLAALDSGQHVYRYRARARLAAVYARRGDLPRAERELATAGAELDAWRGTLTDAELRVAAFQVGEEEDPDLGVPRVIAALATGGREASAFVIAERRRARELADRLARAAVLRASDDAAPGGPAAIPGPGTSAPHAVAAALPDERTALLEYVTGDAGAPTTLFVLTRDGGRPVVRAAALPPADSLAPRIARLVTLLEAGGDPRRLARSLGAELLDPALALLGPGVTRLVIVPDGPLHRVPFDALRLADERYVVERFAVSGAPSAAIAVALWGRPRARAAGGAAGGGVRLLAFGDPRFASERAAPWSDTSRGTDAPVPLEAGADGTLPRLGESGREARLVATFAREAVVRLRDQASESYLKTTSLGGFQVIHFATHALVDERTVARTALALAPGGGESGYVTPGDLAALRLAADLVVLSACRTSGGVVVTGEGVQGLTAPLLQAGARAVVATGWSIGDRATVAFVERFYGAMAQGQTVAEALRTAKLDALRRGATPGEWGAFAVVGDPFVTLPLRVPPRRTPWWLGAGAAAAAAVGLVLTVRNGSARRRPS